VGFQGKEMAETSKRKLRAEEIAQWFKRKRMGGSVRNRSDQVAEKITKRKAVPEMVESAPVPVKRKPQQRTKQPGGGGGPSTSETNELETLGSGQNDQKQSMDVKQVKTEQHPIISKVVEKVSGIDVFLKHHYLTWFLNLAVKMHEKHVVV